MSKAYKIIVLLLLLLNVGIVFHSFANQGKSAFTKVNGQVNNGRVAVLIVHIGPLLDFSNFTIKSLSMIKKMDFFFFSDKPLPMCEAPNVKNIVRPDLKRFFSERIAECLGSSTKSEKYQVIQSLMKNSAMDYTG